MSRYITSRGKAWDQSINLTQTFDTNFPGTYDPTKPQNGIDWQVYESHVFPWLREGKSNFDPNETLQPGQWMVSIPSDSGVDRPYRISKRSLAPQTNINQEISSIMHRTDWDDFEVGDLATLMDDGSGDPPFLRLTAKEIPAQHANKATCIHAGATVQSVDRNARTITVSGRKYYRKRQSTALLPTGQPIYDIGEHMGLDRYLRDELVTDAEGHLDDFKIKRYDHIIAGNNDYTAKFLIDKITDIPERDQRTAPNPTAGGASGAPFLPWDGFATSVHVLQIRGPVPESIQPGQEIYFERRLPIATTMLATDGQFTQVGGVWDFRSRLSWKTRQFSSLWLWPGFQQIGNEINWPSPDKNMEVDVEENPGGQLSMFHNTHRPSGNELFRDEAGELFLDTNTGEYLRPDSMLNYAELNNIPPVMPDKTPEWTEYGKQQHQVRIGPNHPHYINPYEWHDTRVAMFPEGNPYGETGNSVHWYCRTADGLYRFTGGCILSPDAYNGVLEALGLFICNPCDGAFVADMEYYAPGSNSDDDTYPIYYDVAYAKAYQFDGQVAGGSGYPSPNGSRPNGFGPTPNDITGNSGRGQIVRDDTGGSGGGGGTPPVTDQTGFLITGFEDDVSEDESGVASRVAPSLPIASASAAKTVGLRYRNVQIPKNATILSASVQFTAAADAVDPASVSIQAEDVDNASEFSTGLYQLSSRALTSEVVTWAVPIWTQGLAGADQQTPDIASVLQAIVNRPGWSSGNALALVIKGDGDRAAFSYDGTPSASPRLIFSWEVQGTPGGGGGGTTQGQDTVSGYREVGRRDNGGKLLVPVKT